MINLIKYKVLLNDVEKFNGSCPSFAVHLLYYTILQKNTHSLIEIKFKSEKVLKIPSSKLLFEHIPEEVSNDEHVRWFYGNKNNLNKS